MCSSDLSRFLQPQPQRGPPGRLLREPTGPEAEAAPTFGLQPPGPFQGSCFRLRFPVFGLQAEAPTRGCSPTPTGIPVLSAATGVGRAPGQAWAPGRGRLPAAGWHVVGEASRPPPPAAGVWFQDTLS